MTIEEAHTFLDNLMVCIEEHPIVAGWLVEIADRKTENCSEIPNNCETCRHWKYIAKEWQCETTKCQGYEPKTEPQTVRSNLEPFRVDEPQIFTWGKEVHEFCKMKCNKSKARSFDGDRFIVCGQSNDAICINLPACPLGKWITGKGYHILPMDESQVGRSER